MDAFESLIALLLAHDGYWTRTSFKVELTKEEKKLIGRPSSPRWEIDLVAYKGRTNEVLVIECKSLLDSPGVRYTAFEDPDCRYAKRFKLFNDHTLRKTVFSRLRKQLVSSGLCAPNPSMVLSLAAGNIVSNDDRKLLRQHFDRKGWRLFDDEWVRERLKTTAGMGYENETAFIATKILLRE